MATRTWVRIGLAGALCIGALPVAAQDGGHGVSVSRIGVGQCADLHPDAPATTMVASAAGGRARVEVRNYRYFCNVDPEFGAILTGTALRLQPGPQTPNNCICLHSDTLSINGLPPGHITVQLWAPPSEHPTQPLVTTAIDVTAR